MNMKNKFLPHCWVYIKHISDFQAEIQIQAFGPDKKLRCKEYMSVVEHERELTAERALRQAAEKRVGELEKKYEEAASDAGRALAKVADHFKTIIAEREKNRKLREALEEIARTVEIECSGAKRPRRMDLANDRNWRMGIASSALAAMDGGEKAP